MLDRLMIMIVMIFIVLPMVISQQPVIMSNPVFKQNTNITIPLPCTIGGTYCSVSAVCKTTIINPDNLILVNNYVMTHNNAVFEVNLTDTQTSEIGEYQFNVVCSDNGKNSSRFLTFQITPYGEELSVSNSMVYMGVLVLLFVFLVISIFSFFHFDNLLNRVSMIGISYLILIAITFVGWNMAKGFLYNSPYIISFLRITFLTLIIGFFPLLIGGFAFYFLSLMRIREMRELMSRGMDFEDAERRLNQYGRY